jgi:hypothetical protein
MFSPLLFVVGWPLTLTFGLIAPEVAKADCRDTPVLLSADAVLEEWERHAPSIERAFVRMTRYQYDEVFTIEERSRVALHFEPGSRYLYRLTPVGLTEDTVSTKRDFTGKPYEIRSCDPTTWYADTRSVMQIDHSTKTYATFEYPPGAPPGDLRHYLDPQPPGLFNWTLPLTSYFTLHAALATGAQIDVMRTQMTWSMGPQSDSNRIHLIAKPRGRASRNFERLEVLLDANTWQSIAFRIIDPGRTKETVFVVNELQFNDAAPIVSRPDLWGYSLFSHQSRKTPEVEEVEPAWWPILARVLQLLTGVGW